MKTGYVCGSGFNVVSTATRNGRRLVAVVLGAPNPRTREKAAAAMLNFGFKTERPIGHISSTAAGPSDAVDMSKWGCGKTYPGFRSAMPGVADTTPPTPARAATKSASKIVRRF